MDLIERGIVRIQIKYNGESKEHDVVLNNMTFLKQSRHLQEFELKLSTTAKINAMRTLISEDLKKDDPIFMEMVESIAKDAVASPVETSNLFLYHGLVEGGWTDLKFEEMYKMKYNIEDFSRKLVEVLERSKGLSELEQVENGVKKK